MTSPRHLWSGNWRQESEDSRPEAPEQSDEAPTAVQEPPAAPPRPAAAAPRASEPAPSRGGGGRVALITAGFLVPLLIVGALVYAFAIRDNGSSNSSKKASAASTKALPASTTPAPAPKAANAQSIYKSAGPAVASIRTNDGVGTGFLITDNRTLVTNAHVVENSKTVTVKFGDTGKNLSGKVMGVDPSADLAVVKLTGDSAPSDAKPLQLADSSKVAVGQTVVAIGNPFGLDRTVTQGIVSALGREIDAPNGFAIENAIQTDAAINPGNSGGPLLDTGGRVIGVNSQIETGSNSNGNVGIGFAVPSASVARIVPQLAAGKTVEHAWLGVSAGDQTSTGGSGEAVIGQIVSGGPAAQAGLQVGDVVTSIDGKTVSAFSDVAKDVDAKKPGTVVPVTIKRGGVTKTLQVTLGTRPTSASSLQSQQQQQQQQNPGLQIP